MAARYIRQIRPPPPNNSHPRHYYTQRRLAARPLIIKNWDRDAMSDDVMTRRHNLSCCYCCAAPYTTHLSHVGNALNKIQWNTRIKMNSIMQLRLQFWLLKLNNFVWMAQKKLEHVSMLHETDFNLYTTECRRENGNTTGGGKGGVDGEGGGTTPDEISIPDTVSLLRQQRVRASKAKIRSSQ